MFNSFSSALSALKAHSTAVDTVGHNLANVNTAGFKGSDVSFRDVVAESIGGGNDTGMGVSRPITVRNFSQGAIQTTSGALDAAIQGSGFFVVKDGVGSNLLTRDGMFQLDKSGYVVTLSGERVQQYVDGKLEDIQIPTGASGAKPTDNISVVANLDATAEVDKSLSVPVEVVDSLGVTHVVTLKYTKTAENTWSVDALIPGNEIGEGTTALVSLFEGELPTVEFDEGGQLGAMEDHDSDPDTPDIRVLPEPIEITIPVSGGAKGMDIKLNFADEKGASLLTQFAQASSASKTIQDGFPAAEVIGVGMADGGKIVARYGNGQERDVAVLAMALVSNPSSLAGVGNNMFRTGADTATPTYGTAGTGGRGKIKAGSIEASTVDMAREFTNLIVYQRGYQANSRVITTADEMSQETLNLKR